MVRHNVASVSGMTNVVAYSRDTRMSGMAAVLELLSYCQFLMCRLPMLLTQRSSLQPLLNCSNESRQPSLTSSERLEASWKMTDFRLCKTPRYLQPRCCFCFVAF